MAQYFQVLSQSDKSTGEEIRQFYPANIVENPTTVQYVIGANDQAFQGQQILVSSDQVMLVDGQPQQIIVDQSQVSFQNQQYVLQDANIEFQDAGGQQQIFYMDDNHQVQRVETVTEGQAAQPVVLNHQLQSSPPVHAQLTGTASTSTVKTVLNTQRPITLNQLQQNPTVLVPQRQVQIPQVRQPVVVQQAPRTTSIPLQKAQNTSQGNPRMQSRADTTMPVRHKSPLMRHNSSNQDLHLEKKFPTVLTQSKPEPEKKKASRTTTPRARPPIRTVRPTAANSGQHTAVANHDSPGAPIRFPVRPPRPIPRGPTPQGVIHRPPVQPQIPQQPQQHQYIINNPNYIIQPQGSAQAAAQHSGSRLSIFEPSSQLRQIIENTPIDDEYSDSIRMLVILSTGEQRLITFTLPREQCTIMEILETVGLPIHGDTSINCTETFMKEIHYIVHVRYAGDPPFSAQQQPPLVTSTVPDDDQRVPESLSVASPPQELSLPQLVESPPPPKAPTPELPKEVAKLIPGKLAVCTHCGYLSEDFNKCMRCKRKLPDDVKAMNVADQIPSGAVKKGDAAKGEKKSAATKATNGTSTSGLKVTPPSPTAPKRRAVKSKVIEQEPIILTLSSDEEEEEDSKSTATLKLNECHSMLDEISRKEPTLSEYQLTDLNSKTYTRDETIQCVTTSIYCRTIRIGSYRFIPDDHNILISTNEIIMKVPLPNNPLEMKTIKICRSKIVKVLANFQKALPVVFYYVTPSMGIHIRNVLGMDKGSEYYFDPISKEQAFKRITILPEHFGEEAKSIFKQIYGKPYVILEELNSKEANSILVKTCPKELSKSLQSSLGTSFPDVRQLLIYPPGKGGISINSEDYICLAQDQFLNDVIIDFYLKYLIMQFPKEQQEKIHVFSTFFYKKLTTKPSKASRRMNPAEMDSTLTAAQKRHARVKSWTKKINLFDKDFIVIPINESCHWFLAIICFPSMEGSVTSDGKPYKLEPKRKLPLKKKLAALGSVTITQLKVEKEETTICDSEASDKDEAEGDESELESEEEVEEPKPEVVPPIKQPCVLIFDSLAGGTSRSRVVATLRDYLSCEYRTKMNEEKTFNKDNIKCSCPKVPQQTNFTDCGLYLLQYVESFFKTPIKSYQLPIRELKTWFEEITVTKKREDVARLIEELMIQFGRDPSLIPDIQLPTLNGKLICKSEEELEEEEEHEEEEEEEEEEPMEDEEISEDTIFPKSSDGDSLENIERESSDGLKPSQSSTDTSVELTPKAVTTVKPDLTDAKRPSNRETLSYLKAKRIVRHKSNEGSEAKKFKASDST